MLGKARVHVDCVGETKMLAERVLGQTNVRATPVQPGHAISPHWMLMHFGYSTRLVAELTSAAVDRAGTVGVPRGLPTLGAAGPCACLLLAMARANATDRIQIAHAFRVSALSESIRGDDPVGLAACIDYGRFEAVHAECCACGLPEHAIALLDAAWLVATMMSDPHELQRRNWIWTTTLDRFFAIEGYRGIRRRAARQWGRAGAGDLHALTSQFPDDAFANPGFAVFAVEWFLSRMKSLVGKPMAKKLVLDQAVDCSRRLANAGSMDDAAWLEQVAMQYKDSKFTNRGGQWD